jgi:hypothetical protein
MFSKQTPPVIRKVHAALLPLFVSLVVFCYLDRTSLAFAALQLCEEPWFSPQVYGLVSSWRFGAALQAAGCWTAILNDSRGSSSNRGRSSSSRTRHLITPLPESPTPFQPPLVPFSAAALPPPRGRAPSTWAMSPPRCPATCC